MSFSGFLESLFLDGRVQVARDSNIEQDDLLLGDEILHRQEQDGRLDLAENTPEFDLVAARWASIWFFRACQLAVYPDLEIVHLSSWAQPKGMSMSSSEAHYSVDLTLRFLPNLRALIGNKGQKDPLLEQLKMVAEAWPLSSVGMKEVDGVNIEGFSSNTCLMNLYLDRVFAEKDTSRLQCQRTRDLARETLGGYPQLAPTIASFISNKEGSISAHD